VLLGLLSKHIIFTLGELNSYPFGKWYFLSLFSSFCWDGSIKINKISILFEMALLELKGKFSHILKKFR